MKNLYLKNIVLMLIIFIFAICYMLFFGKFQPSYNTGKQGIVHGHSTKGPQENKNLRSRGRNIMLLTLQKNEFDGGHIKEVLHQIMAHHMQVYNNSLPINQESIDWMTRLPFDHAVSMLQILSHTHPVDWQEQVVSLRNLPGYEQKRALKINRFNNNSFECFDKESCNG